MSFKDDQVRQDCIFCMIEEKGLQFVLDKGRRSEFIRWTKRPDEYKSMIRELVKKYETKSDEDGTT